MAQETYADISNILTAHFIEQEEFIVKWLKHINHFTASRTDIHEGCKSIFSKLKTTESKLMAVVNSHVSELENRVGRRDKKVDEVQKSMQQLQNENIKICQERDVAVYDQKSLKVQLNVLNKLAQAQKNQQHESQINELQKQVNKKNNEVDKLNESLNHLEIKNLELRQQKDDMEDVQKNIQLRVKHLENELAQAQKNQQHESQIHELQEQLDKKNNEVNELQKSIQHLENESMKIRAVVDEQQNLRLRVNHLETELAQVERNQEYKSQIEELQEQMDKKVEELIELIKQLQTENTELRQQKDAVVGEEKISQSRLRIDHLEKELLHAQSNQQSVYAELRRMLAVVHASMPHGDGLPEIRPVPSWENLVGSLEQVLGQGQEIHFKRMSDDSVKMYVQSPMPYKSEESTHAKIMQMLAILWPECRKMSKTVKKMIEGKENELEELCTAHSVMNKKFDELVKGLQQWPLRFLHQETHILNSLPGPSTEDE